MWNSFIESGWLARAARDIGNYLPEARRVAVIFDPNTYQAMGEKLIACLQGQYELVLLDCGEKPNATLHASESLRGRLEDSEAAIAVGSGTINDLTKYACTLANIPYVACATAPSMNGYNSATASLEANKIKQSLAATPPCAVFADLDVLCNAPRQMIHAGMGDVLCRSTVQADWLMSHLLLDTPYDASLFKRLIPMENELLSQARLVSNRDPMFIRLLMRMLFTSGEAMAKAGSSAPASQGEHMIAHTYHQLYGEEQKKYNSLHGEQIAVATVSMATVQEKVLVTRPKLRSLPESSQRFVQLFGQREGERLYALYRRKVLNDDQVRAIEERLDKRWPEMKEAIESVRVPRARLENALRSANCPVHPRDIQWSKERYDHAVNLAHLTRERFTFLDLAAMNQRLRVML